MIIDTSALIAILFNEVDADLYANALASSEHRLMSAANYLESAIVVDRQRGAAAGRQLDSLILRAEVKVESVTKEQADIARQAYLDFGKGAHPAGLNFGDCFSYALAKSLGLPLLFKGEDFALTDIESVL
jgi:ribonuclease VapC